MERENNIYYAMYKVKSKTRLMCLISLDINDYFQINNSLNNSPFNSFS